MEWVLERTTEWARPVAELFAFFHCPENLIRITPPQFHLRIESPDKPEIFAGAEWHLRMSWMGLPMRWCSRIDVWDPPVRFVDSQVSGPYRSWLHEHRFEDLGHATRMIDHVTYGLPGRWLGRLVQPKIHRQLEDLFDFRERRIRELLGQ